MKFIFLATFLAPFTILNASTPRNTLEVSWEKQVKPIASQYLTMNYSEKRNELYHSFKPWDQLHYEMTGQIWIKGELFFRSDTMRRGEKSWTSVTQLRESELLRINYGEKNIAPVTRKELGVHIVQTSRYSPAYLLDYFYRNKINPDPSSTGDLASFTTTIGEATVQLAIRTSDSLVQQIILNEYSNLHGDLQSTIIYEDYASTGKLLHPKKIRIKRNNGILTDEVILNEVLLVDNRPEPIEKPADYKIMEDEELTPGVSSFRYSENIQFIDLKKAGVRIMVVEFKDFVLIEGAPLNSAHGELVLQKVSELVPSKPIRYFTFGHFHEHYLGGVRPIIHRGITILSTESDSAYIQYLAKAQHTRKPDGLQREPKEPIIEFIRDSMTITDGHFKMKIYHIGALSGHTEDYLIYHFPTEKMIFEDDLVWVLQEGEPAKPGKTQAGFYNAVKDLNLDVETVVQSWGIDFEKYKTIIPFKEIEEAMQIP